MKPRYLVLFAACFASSCVLPEFGLVDSFDGPPTNAGSSNGGRSGAAGAETEPGGAEHSGAAGGDGNGIGGAIDLGGAPGTIGGVPADGSTAGADEMGGGVSAAGGPPTCDADTQVDRKNCGVCGKVCYAPNDCAQGQCSVCANGCAVLDAPLTTGKRSALFQVAADDFFDADTLTMTGYVASGTSVVVTFSAIYEEGGHTDVTHSYNTGDWLALALKVDPSKGLVAWLNVTVHENGSPKTSTTFYLESITGVPEEFGFGFVRSAGPVMAVYPVDEDPNKPNYTLGNVSWLGPT